MQGGVHLPPQQFHEAMQKDNTVTLRSTWSRVALPCRLLNADQVIIDVRNVYETVIGHFNPKVKAQGQPAAELIDPKMRQSTDFPGWLQVWRLHVTWLR